MFRLSTVALLGAEAVGSNVDCPAQDEASLLQMPVVQNTLDATDSECRCPGYYQEECEAEAAQGCIWSSAGTSNSPWCQCDESVVPPPFVPGPIVEPLPPVVAPLQFDQSGTNNWCGTSNNDFYTQTSSSRSGWNLDTSSNGGWRWCGITADECQTECTGLGDCQEIYWTPNSCCFPSRAVCNTGSHAPGGAGGMRYIVVPEVEVVPFPPDVVPEPEPEDLPELANHGANCWNPCGQTAGACEYCGTEGFCCREGFAGDPEECGGRGAPNFHTCILPDEEPEEPEELAPLQNEGENCWNPCDRTAGACEYCGTEGLCCREGFGSDPAECGGRGASNFHTCILPEDEPEETALQHQGENCWNPCDQTAGSCDYCGTDGLCCREGFGSDPAECGGRGAPNFHTCVLPVVPTTLQNQGANCWNPCDQTAGPCDFCGTEGVCCRQGFATDPEECGGLGAPNFHTCILPVEMEEEPQYPDTEIPEQTPQVHAGARGGQQCDTASVSSEECLASAQAVLTAGPVRAELIEGSWSHVPPGCSTTGCSTSGCESLYPGSSDFAAHYNSNPSGVNNGGFAMICTALAMPEPSVPVDPVSMTCSSSISGEFTIVNDLQDGTVAWADRSLYTYGHVPQELQGATLFSGPHKTRGDLSFHTNRAVTLYVFAQISPDLNSDGGLLDLGLPDLGWEVLEDEGFAWLRPDGAPGMLRTWKRAVEAFEDVVVPLSEQLKGGLAVQLAYPAVPVDPPVPVEPSVPVDPVSMTCSSSNRQFTIVNDLQDGTVAWTDRSLYTYGYVPQELQGATLFSGPHKTRGDLSFHTNRAVTLYVFAQYDGTGDGGLLDLGLPDLGWEVLEDEGFAWLRPGGAPGMLRTWKRAVDAFEDVVVPLSGQLKGGLAVQLA